MWIYEGDFSMFNICAYGHFLSIISVIWLKIWLSVFFIFLAVWFQPIGPTSFEFKFANSWFLTNSYNNGLISHLKLYEIQRIVPNQYFDDSGDLNNGIVWYSNGQKCHYPSTGLQKGGLLQEGFLVEACQFGIPHAFYIFYLITKKDVQFFLAILVWS